MGVPPTNMWLYHVGPQWTKRLLFTGDTVSGSEAASVGLVQAAVAAGRLDGYAMALAARIALVGRDLLAANKRVVNQGIELMGRAELQRFAAVNDAVAHRSADARAFTARAGEVGLKQAVRDRDRPFGPRHTRATGHDRPARRIAAGSGGLRGCPHGAADQPRHPRRHRPGPRARLLRAPRLARGRAAR